MNTDNEYKMLGKGSLAMLHKSVTSIVINAYYEVYNTLGYGFLEKVYENALAHELRERGLLVRQQEPIKVYYGGLLVGEYFADLLVADCIIVELKAVEQISPEHTAQLLNYLKATKIEIGFVFNFGPKAEFARKILTNDRKISN